MICQKSPMITVDGQSLAEPASPKGFCSTGGDVGIYVLSLSLSLSRSLSRSTLLRWPPAPDRFYKAPVRELPGPVQHGELQTDGTYIMKRRNVDAPARGPR